jgi:hypothetical protein
MRLCLSFVGELPYIQNLKVGIGAVEGHRAEIIGAYIVHKRWAASSGDLRVMTSVRGLCTGLVGVAAEVAVTDTSDIVLSFLN